jgi:hypothetical protein
VLSSVDVTTPRGNLLSLPLDDDSSGFRVVEIEGLGPVKANLVSSSFAGLDGEQYQSSRRETRNLKFKIELDPDPTTDTVRSLRQRLYDFFMPKTEASFKFFLEDGLEVGITGRVETCEPDIFTREPTINVSIICFDPDFVQPDMIQLLGMTTADTSARSFDYDGTVDTGVKFVLLPNRSITQFTIIHTTPSGETRTLDFSAPLIAGDWLLIDTIPGEKEVYYLRSGVRHDVLYGISPQSNWISLENGINTLKVEALGPGIPLTFEYFNRYGGL